MEKRLTRELIACLSDCFNQYNYYKDQYAVQLLSLAAAGGIPLRVLKQSAYSGLLNKPAVKPMVAQCGNGLLSAQTLTNKAHPKPLEFQVSWSYWAGHQNWDQTSRPGYQLVLQLNFPEQHDEAFLNKVKPKKGHCLIQHGHPVRRQSPYTLAWARIDLDLVANEALIEEVQTDWLREAKDLYQESRQYKSRRQLRRDLKCWQMEGSVEGFVDYFENDLKAFHSIWEEALLSACFETLIQVIGVRRVYYHHFETGAALKRIEHWLPPRSLYTRLPAKFCMQRVHNGPGFIQANPHCRKRIRRVANPGWFLHTLSQTKGNGNEQAA